MPSFFISCSPLLAQWFQHDSTLRVAVLYLALEAAAWYVSGEFRANSGGEVAERSRCDAGSQ